MEASALLVALGILFLAGLALETAGRKVLIPRVTLLILLGAVVGQPLLDILPEEVVSIDHILVPTALTMVAFLLGGTLERSKLAAHGFEILAISIMVVLTGTVIVAGGLALVGVPIGLALLLGGIAAATDPAAVQDVVRESGVPTPFAERLLAIVAIDDAWGLIIFAAMLTAATASVGESAGLEAVMDGLREIGGAVALGIAVGVPGAYLTGRVSPGEPTLIEALGIVFLTAGLALAFEVSHLLAGMVTGAVIVNLARHHEQPFHEIERIEWPFLLIFFVLAGAAFELGDFREAGLACAAFIVLRAAARIVGGLAGGRIAGLARRESCLTGVALMPQAGVAIGMALVGAERLPQYSEALIAIAVASTVAFEVGGPFLTQFALSRASRS